MNSQAPLQKNMEIREIHSWQRAPLGLISHSERAITLRFQCCLTFYRTFKQKDSMLNTSAITAITKSSMKPRSGTTANRHLGGSGKENGEYRRTKVSFGRTMMWAFELQRLVKRHISGGSDVEKWRNQVHSFSGYRVTLVWRHHQTISQSVSQSAEKSVK